MRKLNADPLFATPGGDSDGIATANTAIKEIKVKSRTIKKILLDIKNKLNNGEDFEMVGKECNQNASLDIQFVEQTFQEKMDKKDLMLSATAFNEAKNLSPVQACVILEEKEGIELIKCLEKKGEPDKAFEEVKDKVKQMFADDKFNTMIN